MLFRKAMLQDLSTIDKLLHSLADEPINRWGDDYPSREMLKRDLDNQNLYVLEENNNIIASASLGNVDDLSKLECWSKDFKNTCEIARIGIAKNFQNKGLAKTFLTYLEKEALNKGFHSIHLIASPVNVPALKLYEHNGYKNKGTVAKFGYDWIAFEKKLL